MSTAPKKTGRSRGGITRKHTFTVVKVENGRSRAKAYAITNATGVPRQPTCLQTSHSTTLQNDSIEPTDRYIEVDITPIPGTKPKKSKSQDDMLNEWLAKQDQYMSALLDYEDIGSNLLCAQCMEANRLLFRCTACLETANYCQPCLVQRHRSMPFHRVMAWDGQTRCFRSTSLGDLGLILRLCHRPSQPCHGSIYSVTVVHSNGIHNISVQFCTCPDSKSPDLQLFAFRLFPATVQFPQSAVSFEVLEQFRLHHLEGKGSVYTFMNALYRLTDDTGCMKIEDRTREFRRISRQWNHLQSRKALGRYGDSSYAPPSTVVCPACPHPGKNIPFDWINKIPIEKQWLYRVFMHFDANFRLTLDKQKNRSGEGISLWGSTAFFVDVNNYQHYLETTKPLQREASDCVDHKAVMHASKSRFDSLEVSGVAGAVCRHECAVPNSFVNLTHGERYVNSDYGISNAFKSMRGLKEIVLSYDIACQYSRRMVERFSRSPVLEMPACDLIFAVPKFHLPAHREQCRHLYSFNYLKKVGRTDGEAIERFWSTHNFLSGSTTRMSPESRLDTLNAHFADWNWRKLCNMGEYLKSSLKEARAQVLAHQHRFNDFCASISKEEVERFSKIEDDFVPEPGKKSIYQLATEEAPSQAAILRELSQYQDPTTVRQDHLTINQPAAAIWINDGLELEDTLRLLSAYSSTINSGSTERDRVLLNRRKVSLYTRLIAWKRQSPFGNEGDDGSDPDNFDAEPNNDKRPINLAELKIPLPSNTIESDEEDEENLDPLYRLEIKLRIGQAHDALKQLRKALGLRLALIRGKKDIHGQRNNLRSQSTMNQINNDIDAIAARYRVAYSALLKLKGVPPELKPLKPSDITTSKVFKLNPPLGKGFETQDLTWIWTMHGVNANLQDNNWLSEVLRVQFLDVKTTLDRWKEEEELIQAEFFRTAEYFRWMGYMWGFRGESCLVPGERAHAFSMRLLFANLEQNIRDKID